MKNKDANQTALLICTYDGLICINRVSPFYDKDVWTSSVRYAMRAASQLPGREPTDVDDAPAPAH